MGVRILSDEDNAVLYCSTSDWAFGPVFYCEDEHDAHERAEAFLRWLDKEKNLDPRYPHSSQLESLYSEWRAQEDAQWAAEEKAEEDKYNEDLT